MFERRLKTLLVLLVAVAAALVLRAAHVQVINTDYWRQEASKNMRRTQLLPTVRGSILDAKGRKLAMDEPCIDAAVDYRAIIRDPDWIEVQLRQRLRANPEHARADRATRARIRKEESARLDADLDQMWRTLAQVAMPPKTLDEMELIKVAIRRQVEMRRRHLWYILYRQAVDAKQNRPPAPWYREWLLSEEPAPQLDNFSIEVAEQSDAHVILPAVSPDVHNYLKKQVERFPGLVLRPSKHRVYPYGAVGCHIMGHLSKVSAEDREKDPNAEDELRSYGFTDLIGRGGVEGLCDQALRGVRGKVVRELGREGVLEHIDPTPGRDVRLTIDIELQAQIEHAFRRVAFLDRNGRVVSAHVMHGAAVVLKVDSGELLALASWPTYDVNQFDQLYKTLAADRINKPLLNRATQLVIEPGSTIKPVVGLGAVADGLIATDGIIECTGHLIINGEQKSHGKCWTVKRLLAYGITEVAHHTIPTSDPHPTGHLTLSDALQRSCNIFFELLGDKMGLEGLSNWYRRFGLGGKTEIGIPEWSGRVPDSFAGPLSQRRAASWFSAIGQSQVLATPIQMANVAATIARDGIWMRPQLVVDRNDVAPTSQPATADRIDLGLPRSAVAAAREGMVRAVNTRGGTGYDLRRKDTILAGKTGTATAAPFTLMRLDAEGKPVRDERGRIVYDRPSISTLENPNPAMPWYRGSGGGLELSHAWFIGYAPAHNPTIAFAVVMEYGGSGGHDTAPIVKAVLDACMEHGYLPRGNSGE